MDWSFGLIALSVVLGFAIPLMPGRIAATVSLVFMALAVLICGWGAYFFWADSRYGNEGWDPVLFLPTVYFALVVVTLAGLFVTRHSSSSWRIGIGGVAMAALVGTLPLLALLILFAGPS